MLRLRSRSLRAKLIIMVSSISITALGLGFLLVVIKDIRTFRREMRESTVLMAQVAASYSVSDLLFLDREDARKTLVRLVDLPMIEYACLYDDQGRLFCSVGNRDEQSPAQAVQGASVELRRGALHVHQPVMYEGKTYGSLYLRASTRHLRGKILGHVLTMVSLAVALMVLCLLVTWRLERLLSEPILQLAATTRRISETGDHTIRVAVSGDDEIAALCNSFNEMLNQLHLHQLERDAAELRTREKSQFLAAMSHELRTPLNSIIGFSELLLMRAASSLEPKHRKFLDNIHRSGRLLLGIINDILDLSKVEAGRMDFCPEPLDIHETVEGVVTVMRGMASKRHIEISVELDDDLPEIEADPVKLKQVLFNLLSNAVKFSHEGSAVRVTGRVQPAASSPLGRDSIELAVVDKGIGIASRDWAKIFQPFRQADSGIARRFGGTGLGLALVKAFVERHGGRVLVDSTVGVGSTFAVVLPLLFPGRDVEPQAGEVVDISPTCRVLVIEGLAETINLLRRQLAEVGCDVIAAADAQHAVDLVRRFPPSLILADTELPQQSSWDLLQTVKMHRKTTGIPVILFTVVDEHRPMVCLAADDYFIKPLGTEKLVKRISELVAGQESPLLLIIDDDQMTHDLLEGRLAPAGFKLQHAISGEEGLRLAAQREPQLIILSLMMEQMDGFEVAHCLRRRKSTEHVPLVVTNRCDLSSESRRWIEQRVATLAALETRALQETVREMLARSRPEAPAGR